MSTDKDKSQMVPSGVRGLTKYGSSLVRRGLDDLDKSLLRPGSRVLLVDDEPAIVEVVEQLLISQGYQVRSTCAVADAIEIARQFRPDVAMVGLVMPVMNGVELGNRLSEFLPDTKIVLWVEGSASDDYGFELFPTPFEKEDLFKRMKSWVDTAHENARREPNGELTIPAQGAMPYDARRLQITLDIEISRSIRYGYQFSLLWVDLDSSKELSKSMTSVHFNTLLDEIADTLKEQLRLIDFLFYVEDGEFVVLATQSSKRDGCVIAHALHKLFRETSWLHGTGQAVMVPARIGVATFPEDGKTRLDLVRSLDDAMNLLRQTSHDGVVDAAAGILSDL